MAADQPHYLQLRLHAPREDWMDAAERCALPEAECALLTADQWQWWTHYVRGSQESGTTEFHRGTRRHAPSSDGWRGNYLHDAAAFQRVHAAACRNAIRHYGLDWFDTDGVVQLGRVLKSAGMMIGVFDISNAWQDRYLGGETIVRLVRTLFDLGVAQPESVVLGTIPFGMMAYYPGYPLSYQGWTFRHLLGEGEQPFHYDWRVFGGDTFDDYRFDSGLAR